MVCFSVKDDCYNPYESYGEICVHCGCCSKDKSVRYERRLEMWRRLLQDTEAVEMYSDLDDEQRKNLKLNKRYYRRRIRYYMKRLEEISNEED